MAAEDNLEASVAGYDDVLVTLLSATWLPTTSRPAPTEADRVAQANVELQRGVLNIATAASRPAAPTNWTSTRPSSSLKQIEPTSPRFEIALRQAD